MDIAGLDAYDGEGFASDDEPIVIGRRRQR